MSFLRPTFRAKTALTLTLVGALILLVLSWRVLSHMHVDREEALIIRTQAIGELFAVTAKDAVTESDLATLQGLTKEIVELPGIVYARVRDIDNRVLASSGQAPDPNLPIAADIEVDHALDGVLDQTAYIKQGASRFGRVEFGVSVEPLYAALRESAIGVAAFAAAGLFVVAVCGYLFAALLVRPLTRLRDGAERIADGELGHTLPVDGHDEIAATALAFNRMSNRMRELIDEQADQHRLTEIIRTAQSDFIHNANDSSFFQRLLTEIVHIAQSEAGFLGRVEPPQSGGHEIEILAVTGHEHGQHAFAAHPEIQRALTAVAHSSDSHVDAPAEDEALPRWWTLYVPLSDGNLKLGVIVLAKRSGYDQDTIPRLRILWSALTALIHAFRSEQHRRQAERDLTASAQRTRALLDNVIDGIISIDTQGTILECNPAAEKLFGYARRELNGKNVKVLMPDPSRSAHDGYLAQYIKTGIAGIIGIGREVRAVRKDGGEFPLQLGISVIRNENGPSCYIGVARDISAQKETENALLHARDVALWTNQAKSHFLATISHELRTPMHGVLGMLDLVRKTQLSEQQEKFIEAAQRSGHNLLDIINDVLDLSKLEAGEVEIANEPFYLPALIADFSADLQTKASVKGIAFESLVDANVPARLSGDHQKLRQILVNLAGNAVKFTDHGGVAVRIHALETNDNAVLLRCEVADTGIGIHADASNALFRPFQQGDTTTTRRFGGTGLGLALCKQLTETMGGEIGLQSTLGVGSVFWFTIRLNRNASVAAPAETQATETKNASALASADLSSLDAADLERLQGLHKMLGARFRELVDKFEDNTRVILERMQTATETSNTDELMRAAHSLKGSSGTIGATAIFKVSSALEEAARQGPVDDAAATVAQLRTEYVRFHNAVEQMKQA